jgi:hypothetical protein
MFRIEFEGDHSILNEERALRIDSMDAEIIEETGLVMPVRMIANGVPLLTGPPLEQTTVWIGAADSHELEPSVRPSVPQQWLPLPLIDVATTGPHIVEVAKREGVADYRLPGLSGMIRFRRVGEEMIVQSTISGADTKVEIRELESAFHDFAASVRKFISQELPELTHHSAWERWFPS